ncbi:MAG TPA: hypothetical protein VFS05_03270 [Gemmatimonadaceae bacterium]|nr:hypothetical protein [Gemmatimonadaceae bacterium]
MESARNRSAAVLPIVGAVCMSEATTLPSLRNPCGGKNTSPAISSPVASAHPATKVAWSCITAGPMKRTLLSRHWSSCRPSPNHLSSIPKPPV